ncbi:MAG: AI-2E family transporter [Candidatus Acidiferrales bacterium]
MNRRNANIVVLLILLAIGTIVAYGILRPFLRPIVFGLVIGIGFYPLHTKIGRFFPRKNIHALVSTLAVLLIFVVPAVLLVSAASEEIIHAAQSFNDRAAEGGGLLPYFLQGPDRLMNWLEKYVDIKKSGLAGAIDSLPIRASQLLVTFATSLVRGLAGFVGESVITLLILFFMFRDGPGMLNRVAAMLPLDRDRTQQLFSQVRQSVFANLYGILAVALAQGLLTSAGVAIVGVGSSLLLGIAAAVCSLIPFVGPALVWLPLVILLLFKGHWWKGLFLLVWGAIAVGTADNIIRPLVIAARVRLHPLLLLFSLIGGVQEFGFVGLFIGPVVMSVVIALVDMLREEFGEITVKPASP